MKLTRHDAKKLAGQVVKEICIEKVLDIETGEEFEDFVYIELANGIRLRPVVAETDELGHVTELSLGGER